MASGVSKQEGNRYDCKYEQPWGGVASNADPSDIQPNQFVTADGLFVKNGRLNSAGWGNTTIFNFSNVVTQGYFNGLQVDFTAMTYAQSTDEWTMYAFVSSTGSVYRYLQPSNEFVLAATLGFVAEFDCFQIIAGVVYIFDFLYGKMYVFDSDALTITTGQSYVGGKYCMVLDGYLLTAFTNQPTDVPAIKTNRYNWSGPFKYTTWDPAVDRTAGFNTLTSASDQITGMFAMGNVGYILRTQGLSQLTPTGVGIAPFQTTDLWSSTFGLGCSYPKTFAQYGALAIWANDSNIYSFFSGSMPTEICGAARRAIYADLNLYRNSGTTTTSVSGCISTVGENSATPELIYTFAIIHVTTSGSGSIVGSFIWTYNINSGTWTRQTPDLDAQIKSITGSSVGYSVNKVSAIGNYQLVLSPGIPPKGIRNNILITVYQGGVFKSILFSFYYSSEGGASGCPVDTPINLVLRQEEFRLGTSYTARGAIVKLAGIGTVNTTVTNQYGSQALTPIVLTDVTRPLVVDLAYGQTSGENLQLALTSTNFDGAISKIVMSVTYDEGEPL